MRPKGTAADFGLESPAPPRRVALDPNELPERLDVGQPGWRRFAGRIRVMLDGDDVTSRCVAFDCNKGTITRQRLDEAGRIYLDPGTDRVAVETLTGAVKVAWR